MKKSKLFLMGILTTALVFGLAFVTGCSTDDDDGIGPDALNGTWIKDGGTNNEKFEKDEHGQTYFRQGPAGGAVIMGELTSYDGTTAEITPYDDDEPSTTFTATVAGSTLTVSGLTGIVYGFDTSNFNGTYTKEP
jgi:hypothetical protein